MRRRSLWQRYARTGSRFVVVSAFNTVLCQSVLVLAHSVFGWGFAASNLFAAAVEAGPAYLLTRYWAWEKTSQNHLMREIVPFWCLGFLGLALSTIAASIANRYSNAQLLLNTINLAAFGVVWVFKFFILDRFMFGAHDDTPKGEKRR
jgi:putative flippase GtrA